MTTDEKNNTDTIETTGGDDSALKKALEAERKARRDAESRAKEAEGRVSETENRLKDLETAQLRDRVAAEKGLTREQASRLRGESAEELESDADDLLAAFKSDMKRDTRPREHLIPAGNLEEVEDMATIADRILGV